METLVILTRPNCIYCEKAKKLIEEHGDSFVEFDVTKDTVFRAFLKVQGITTVPQIYSEGEHIGGYTDLATWYQGPYPQETM